MDERAYPHALYAAVHTGNSGDIEFYLRACAGVDPVLELGCGVGRLGRRLIEAGHEVVGLDHDRNALTCAAAAGIITVAADMRRFHIRRRFARIIIP